MGEYQPVRPWDDLQTLDNDETLAGYRYGREGFREPYNVTRSLWHGWRCGAMDAGLIEIDEAHRELVAAVFVRNSTPKSAGGSGEEHS